MQSVVVIPYRRFGTSYRCHLQQSRIRNIATLVCPETSVRNYYYSPRNSPEERGFLPISEICTVAEFVPLIVGNQKTQTWYTI